MAQTTTSQKWIETKIYAEYGNQASKTSLYSTTATTNSTTQDIFKHWLISTEPAIVTRSNRKRQINKGNDSDNFHIQCWYIQGIKLSILCKTANRKERFPNNNYIILLPKMMTVRVNDLQFTLNCCKVDRTEPKSVEVIINQQWWK